MRSWCAEAWSGIWWKSMRNENFESLDANVDVDAVKRCRWVRRRARISKTYSHSLEFSIPSGFRL